MIVRTWQCTTRLGEDAHAYFAFLTARVIMKMEGIAGFKGVQVLRRDTKTESVFTVMSRWASLEAIKTFAGDDLEQAVIEPEIRRRLSTFDERAQHHVLVHEHLHP